MQPTPTRSPTCVLGDVGADLGDDAGDLVAGHDREGLRAPVAADGVDVGVADAGVLDLDQDVVGADVAALDGGGGQRLAGGGGGVGVDAHGGVLLVCGRCGGVSGGRCQSTAGAAAYSSSVTGSSQCTTSCSVVAFVDGEVDHEPVGGGAVPVLLVGLEEDAVAGADDLDGSAAALAQADALGDEDGLARAGGGASGCGRRA